MFCGSRNTTSCASKDLKGCGSNMRRRGSLQNLKVYPSVLLHVTRLVSSLCRSQRL